MNRYLAFGATGAFAVAMLGYSIWLGAVIGLVLAIATTPTNNGKRVIIEDIATGRLDIQPDDRATRRYVQGQGDNN